MNDSLKQQNAIIKEITTILDKVKGEDSRIDLINKKLKDG